MNVKPSGQPFTTSYPVNVLRMRMRMNGLTVGKGSKRVAGIIHVLLLSHNWKPNDYHQTEASTNINDHLDKKSIRRSAYQILTVIYNFCTLAMKVVARQHTKL